MKTRKITRRVFALIALFAFVVSSCSLAFASEIHTFNSPDATNHPKKNRFPLSDYAIFDKVAYYHPVWSEGGYNPLLAVNLATESSTYVKNNTNVNLYEYTKHISQQWKFIQDEMGKYRVVTMVNPRYAWNVYRYGGSYNCDVMPYENNSYDSEIASFKSSTSSHVMFILQNYREYQLVATGNTSGTNVQWIKGGGPETWAGGFSYSFA